ncbi:hypothetical protein B0O99DRAFT_268977 [Bisporella sp. PMI_857]|nr:hypothetical protein B0O99DRAFT_268977 [Bisporella sp. PMI_857]
MKPKDFGSFKVKNTLVQTPSNQAVYSREKPFDLQNGKHNPPRTRTSLPNHNKVIVLEASESGQPNRRTSLTRSSQSHQNVGSNGVASKRDTGVQEYRVVQDNVNPRRKRERRKNSQPSTNGNSAHSASREGSNSMEPVYTAVRLDDAFEDPDDRIEVIYDNEETKRPSKKPKHSNTSRYFDEKDELSIHDSSQISEGRQNYRPSGKGKRPKVQQDGQRDLSRSSTKYETIHNLDDLPSSHVSSGDASHLIVARTLLAKQRQHKQSSGSDDENGHGSQGGSQSSDDYKRVESDIKPSTFETKLSKNRYNHSKLDPGPSKIGKRKRDASNDTTAQQEYHACRILESSSEGLVCDLQPSPCLLLHEAAKTRLLRRHESVPRLRDIVLEGLNRIEFSTDSPLIFLHFHRNLSSDSQLLILCLLLQSNKESAGLREALCQADSAIKKISKDK